MLTDTLTYEQQVIEAPRPGGLAYVLFFLLGALAINTFYLVFEQEERRFVLWALLASGFAVSFFAQGRHRIYIHRFIDVASILTLVWFILVITGEGNQFRFGNYLGQMVCVFLVLFAFRSFRQNDFAWLMVIALVIMMLCSIPIYAASYIYSLIGFVFLLACGMVSLNLYPGQPDHRAPEEAPTPAEWTRQFGQLLATCLVIGVICGGIFAAVPQRVSSRNREVVREIFGVQPGAVTRGGYDESYENAGYTEGEGGGAYSGFSESFDLSMGRVGPIREDTTPLLEVRGDAGPPLRALAWDVYTGRSWVRSTGEASTEMVEDRRFRPDNIYDETPPQMFRPSIDDFFEHPYDRTDEVQRAEFGQRLEELEANARELEVRVIGPVRAQRGYLFLPFQPFKVKGEFTELYLDDMDAFRIERVSINIDGTAVMVPGEGGRMVALTSGLVAGDSYTAYYEPKGTNPPHRDPPQLSPADELRYTDLPEAVPQSIRQLGRSLGEGATDSHEVVTRIHEYLLRQKRYTLNPPTLPEGAACAVDYWLNQSTEGGHCELFSSAAAVLLRAAGVPCRVVTGFGAGTYSLARGAWIIQGRDAHAWVEVFHRDTGWTTFDPTPADWSEGVSEFASEVAGRISRSLEEYFIYNPQAFWRHDLPHHLTNLVAFTGEQTRGLALWGAEPLIGIPRGFLAAFGLLACGSLLSLSVLFRSYRVPFGDFPRLRQTRTRVWSLRQHAHLMRRLRQFDPALPEGLTLDELADEIEHDRPRLAMAVRELDAPFGAFHYARPGVREGFRARLAMAWKQVQRRLP